MYQTKERHKTKLQRTEIKHNFMVPYGQQINKTKYINNYLSRLISIFSILSLTRHSSLSVDPSVLHLS